MGFIFTNPANSGAGSGASLSCSTLLSQLAACPSSIVPPAALVNSVDVYVLLKGGDGNVYWITLAQLLRNRPAGLAQFADDAAADADTALPAGGLYVINDGLDRGVYIKPATL